MQKRPIILRSLLIKSASCSTFNNSDTLADGTLNAFELNLIYVCLHVRIYIFVLYISICAHRYPSICTYVYIYMYMYTYYVFGVEHEEDFQFF